MSGTDVAGDVPELFDVVIDGYGYVTARAVDPNMPFRVQQVNLSYTPTFLERTNVGAVYGDDQQAFFMTESLRDWSGGAQQRHMRADDPDSSRQFWASSGVDITVPGQVSLLPAVLHNSPAFNVRAVCGAGSTIGLNTHVYVDSTSLSTVSTSAAITNKGGHGAGDPLQWGLCNDGVNVYVAGATTIRRWNGTAFSNFGAANANAGALAFLNNALYSCDGSVLVTYSGAGVATTLFTWKDATNTALLALGQHPKLRTFGGKLLIYFPYLASGPQLWIYDGTSTSLLAELPRSAVGYDIEVVNGIVFLSALITDAPVAGSPTGVPVIFYYVNGTLNELWRSTSGGVVVALNSTYAPTLGSYAGRLIFTDPTNSAIRQYDIGAGAISTIGGYSLSGVSSTVNTHISSVPSGVFLAFDSGVGLPGAYLYPDPANIAANGTIQTSLMDFGNSLTKIFRSVKADWEAAGTVDLAYQVDALTGSWTTFQSSAVSGTDYPLPANTNGRSISIQAKLNNSAGWPTLKRIYVRAAGVMQSYKVNEYILDLGGDANTNIFVRRRDNSDHNLSGEEMRVNLAAAITATAPITVTDRTGTFTAVLEPANCEFDLTRPGQWYARIRAREV